MTSIIKEARIRHTFRDDTTSGWVPPHTPWPPRTPEPTLDLVVRIDRVEGGFILQWIGPEPRYSGNHWFIELRYAQHAAEELFGIAPDQWEPAA